MFTCPFDEQRFGLSRNHLVRLFLGHSSQQFVVRTNFKMKSAGARQEYSETLNATLGTFNNVTNGHKTKICNDAYTDMAVCISTTFNFNVMAPDSKDPPYNKEVFGRMFLGPYADDLLPGRESNYGSQLDHNDYDANQGSLKEVRRSWTVRTPLASRLC